MDLSVRSPCTPVSARLMGRTGRRALCSLAAGIFAWLLLGAFAVTSAATRDSAASIRGTITLHGCLAKARDFSLRAEPTSGSDPTQPDRPGPAGGVTRATVRTDLPAGREFTFDIPNLKELQVYLLDFQFLSQSCGKVFWSGFGTGRAFPGQELHIDGYAARTRVEILGTVFPPNPVSRRGPALRSAPRWVGADILDFTDPVAGIRQLRVQTDLPNITSMVLQIAADPFPTGGADGEGRAACEDDSKTVRAVEFPVAAGRDWTELPPINFNRLLLPPRIGVGDPDAIPAVAGAPGDLPPIDPNVLKMLQAGAPLYMRAIPVDADGVRRCDEDEDGVSGWIKVVKQIGEILEDLPPYGKDLRIYSAFYSAPVIHPWPIAGKHQFCVRAIVDHPIPDTSSSLYPLAALGAIDPYAYDFVTGNPKEPDWKIGGTIHAGDSFCYNKKSSSSNGFLDVATGLATGFIDSVGGFVNSAAALWESVKTAVVNIAADVIAAVGVPCEEECKFLLTTGLNIAMASAGIPPSLPNMEQVKQQGIAYVAAQIADQSPVPGTGIVAEHALEYAVEAVEEYAKQGGGQGLPSWLAMDLGLEPAMLTVNLEREQPLLSLDEQDSKHLEFYPPSVLALGTNAFFEGQGVRIPKRFWTPDPYNGFVPPGTRDLLKFPIVLKPNLSKIPANEAAQAWAEQTGDGYWLGLWNKDHWAATTTSNPCTYFYMDWFLINEGVFPPDLDNVKHLGTLGNNVLYSGDFGPGPLADPAQYNFCQ